MGVLAPHPQVERKSLRNLVFSLLRAELEVRWPAIPIVFCETRKVGEEWTYRYLAAAHTWAATGVRLERPAVTVPVTIVLLHEYKA